MKAFLHCPRILSLLFFILLITSCQKHIETTPDPLSFAQPETDFAIHTWWHWMDNAISKEGITADLEAMKEQGISTATILNVSLFQEKDLGIKPVYFNTPEWYEMFRWALEEANRLGIKIGVHNCDGWSTSGGPWIKPEQSMKQCVWSRSMIIGNQEVSMQLPVPQSNHNFYKDIAVLAYPADYQTNSFQQQSPLFEINDSCIGSVLMDGNPLSMIKLSQPTVIDITCHSPIKVSQFAIHPRKSFQWGYMKDIKIKVILEASTGNSGFQKIAETDNITVNKTTILPCLSVVSDKFRLNCIILKDNEKFRPLGISEFELLSTGEKPLYNTLIPFHLEKTATTKASDLSDMFFTGTSSDYELSSSDVIDLSSNLSSDGFLKWKAPEGKWNILRIGYTTTESVNRPSTKAGCGLECDKMDTTALNFHFNQFPAKLVEEAGTFTGNTFDYLFVDSWECGYQNWTQNFPAEFEKRRGYSIYPWLPVIAGELVNGQNESERFLQDYRQTISDLIEENYYKHFNTLCHRLGVKSHAEVIYGGTGYPPLDVLKTNKYVDVPMFEFWAGLEPESGLINYHPVNKVASELPMQAANLYGKNMVPAEAYTGYANYSESPWDLKLFGDKAFCSGVNAMVLHSYVHQPDDRFPGITLGKYGQTFNRHNPWWDYASQWFSYHSRIQYMLQKSLTHADILCFTGERLYDQWSREWEENLPNGFSIQKCNSDILLYHTKIKNSKIQTDNGISYNILLLPQDEGMELSTLRQIEKLVKKGAVIAGPKPTHTLSLFNAEENDSALKIIADTLWGKADDSGKYFHSYGKGKVYGGYSIEEIISKEKYQPDFTTKDSGQVPLAWTHKKSGDMDLYFVVNQENREIKADCQFHSIGINPQIWDPQYGTVYNVQEFNVTEEITSIPVKLPPKTSLFFIFGGRENKTLPIYGEPENSWEITEFTGYITFLNLPQKDSVSITSLKPYSESQDTDIRYYSGKTNYKLYFNIPDSLANKNPLYLSLGETGDAFELNLNNHSLGTAAFPNHRFEISAIAKSGKNKLEVQVGNSYRNAIISERIKYGELKDLWTTSPMYQLPIPGMPLKKGGISGSVKLTW